MGPALHSGLAQQNLDVAFMIDKVARVPISKIVIFALVLTAVRIALFFYLKNRPIHLRDGLYSFLKFINDISDALVYAAVVVFMLVRPFGIQTFFIPSASMVDTLRIGDFIVANKFIYRASEPKPGDIVVFKPPKGAIQDPAQQESDFIKRCLGVPGDIVEFDKFQLIRNGKPVEEPYKTLTQNSILHDKPHTPEEIERIAQSWQFGEVTNPPKFKFVEHEGEVKPLFYEDRPGQGLSGIIYMSEPNKRVYVEGESLMELVAQDPQPIPDNMYLMVGDNRNGSNDGRFWGLIQRNQIIGKAEFVWLPFSRAKNLKNSEDYKL